MHIKLLLATFFTVLTCFSFAQEDSDTSSFDIKDIKPEVGVGIGMMSFYGDVGIESPTKLPFKSRVGIRAQALTHLNSFLDLELFMLHGRLYGNERSLTRNLNFESRTLTGGATVHYNFNHLLKARYKVLTPYVFAGLELTRFKSYMDLKDADGTIYHYWTDGTIRDKPQETSTTENANILQRDYVYETHIRSQNFDGLGNYPQIAFSLPVGGGLKFQFSYKMNMRLFANYHVTSSDLIDGVSSKSKGIRKSSPSRDKFLFSGISINYDFGAASYYDLLDEKYAGVDFGSLDSADQDYDGVKDLYDHCPNTPSEASVDTRGCPLDDDADGVPNYRDKELYTPTGMPVDIYGVQLSDSALLAWQNMYFDSTGTYLVDDFVEREFKVEIASVQPGESIPPELNELFLGIEGISTKTLFDGTTIYMVGSFPTAEEAEIRRQELIAIGIKDAQLIQWSPQYEKGIEADPERVAALMENRPSFEGMSEAPVQPSPYDNRTIFRVQIGAFKSKVSDNSFKNIKDVMYLPPSEDEYSRYYTGEFSNYKEALQRQLEVQSEGFKDAFIVTFKNGKRVGITDVTSEKERDDASESLKPIQKYLNENSEVNVNPKGKAESKEFSREDLVFKVQVGLYKNEVPVDRLTKFLALENVEQQPTSLGMTRYTAGKYKTYDEAVQARDQIIRQGIEGAFVIAVYKGEVIPVQDALPLLEK